MNYAPLKPLIITIIPTYRRLKRLRRIIRSVLNQTYAHFQVCIYDNASSAANLASLVKNWPKKINVRFY